MCMHCVYLVLWTRKVYVNFKKSETKKEEKIQTLALDSSKLWTGKQHSSTKNR